MNLPPFLRKIQQSYLFHFLIMPAILAAIPAFMKCAGENFENLSVDCFMTGGKLALGYIAIYLYSIMQHPPGSPLFNPDGSTNKQVQEVVAATQAGTTVEIVPK